MPFSASIPLNSRAPSAVIEIPDASPANAGVMSQAQATQLAALPSNPITATVAGVVSEAMAGLPKGLTLPGAKVALATGTNAGTITDQRSEFESVISVNGQIQQIGGPSGVGVVSILLTQQ
jgi:hypothetical protein